MSERLGRLGVEFVISIMSGTVCRFVVSSVSTRDDAVILLIYAGLTICTHCQAFLLSHTLSTCLDISHSVRCVDACGAWDKESEDVVGIFGEFCFSVREGRFRRSDCLLPGEYPISGGPDEFCWFGRSGSQLNVSNPLHCLGFGGDSIRSREDDIEVDRFSGEHISPLGVGETRDSWRG